jgi:hypothetical protein
LFARLVRLCGLDLVVMLNERDDSDMAQAERLKDLTPEQRVRRMERVARELNQLRKAGARSA